ncbi:hypothetical protein [Burkholderia lata]|uniref:hypothetical protein n=1 Tax=Burkholderia lata (strain ATCC 17760 / DSM 23089 / LMG 22485 / NCIMB 9086 / R18194 / 383) TaxID=482957 RepID=UPI00399A06CA
MLHIGLRLCHKKTIKSVVEVDQSYLVIPERRDSLAGCGLKWCTIMAAAAIVVGILEPKCGLGAPAYAN